MISSTGTTRLSHIPRSIHFWIILALLIGLSILHYIEEIGFVGVAPSLHFGLERHAMDRILFLMPIVYTLIVFGYRKGLVITLLTLIIMLPRATIWSPNPRDALFEIGSIIFIAVALCLWFRSRERAEVQRQRAMSERERFQVEIQSQIEISRGHQIRLSLINAISTMLTHSFDVKSLLGRAIDMVTEVVDVEIALIYSLDEKSSDLVLISHHGVSDRFVEEANSMKIGEGFNGLVASKGEPLQVEDASLDPRLTKEVVREEGIRSQVIVPLKAKGKTIGTLCVGNRRPRQFVSDEVEILTAIGNQIAIAIENSRLYQEQQMTASQYRSIFDNAREAIWVEDADGRIFAANEAMARLTGYSQDVLLGMKTASFLYPNETKALQEQYGLLSTSLSDESYDRRLIRRDGIELLVSLTSSSITSDGRPVAIQHIARDVTRERQVKDNLRFFVESITKALEEERKRISRELHDETAQSLIALAHQLEDFARNNKHLTKGDVELIDGWRTQVKDSLEDLRRFTRDLRPLMLDDLGLVPSLEWIINELKRTTNISTELTVVGTEQRFSAEVELLIFRIVQEALANIRRHSEACHVVVSIEYGDIQTRIQIKDNGKGFSLPTEIRDLSKKGKLGLIGMEERSRLIGGSLEVQSELNRGTTISVIVPTSSSIGSRMI